MARYLLLHGFGGVGPDHWLVWLSTELRARGHVARIRKLPAPMAPDLDAWMSTMRERLAVLGAADGHALTAPGPSSSSEAPRAAALGEAGLPQAPTTAALGEGGDPSGELVVVAHSLGARLWLQHAQEFDRGGPHPVADRAALVAPPLLPDGIPATRFHELDVAHVRPERAARHTRLVVSGNDRYWPGGGAAADVGEPLGLPVDRVGDHGHLEPADGYGPWPSMLAWCLGETETISS